MTESNITSDFSAEPTVENTDTPNKKGEFDKKDEDNDNTEDSQKLLWMIRPCEIYNEEYKDCKSMRARFHQYFIYGKSIDCSQWKDDYQNCYLWDKHKSQKAYDKLIKSETERRMTRLRPHYQNNIWERRDKPPEDWNAPLPEWIQRKIEKSYLTTLVEMDAKDHKSSFCSIS